MRRKGGSRIWYRCKKLDTLVYRRIWQMMNLEPKFLPKSGDDLFVFMLMVFLTCFTMVMLVYVFYSFVYFVGFGTSQKIIPQLLSSCWLQQWWINSQDEGHDCYDWKGKVITNRILYDSIDTNLFAIASGLTKWFLMLLGCSLRSF